MEQLDIWKSRVSATHLTGYLYNPLDFYLTKVLKTREASQIEEELSVMNYGNLVHYALQIIYEGVGNEILKEQDLTFTDDQLLEVINKSIENLNHQPEFYDKDRVCKLFCRAQKEKYFCTKNTKNVCRSNFKIFS